MGLPSGRRWAVANIDVSSPSGFQEVEGMVSPFKYECSFCSWGNTDMYNPRNTSSFDYNWGSVNPSEPYYEGQPYGSTPGAALTSDFGLSSDAARRHLGAPWRMPSKEEFQELFNFCDFIDADGAIITAADKRITMNGVVGLRMRSRINGNVIFFPASGVGVGTTWSDRRTNGYYWSSSWSSARYARGMSFSPSGVGPQGTSNRFDGFAVRPVF